jgi:hypothetical protein
MGFEVMLPSACSFIVDVSLLHLVVAVLHYMFRPTWPSLSVYNVFTSIFLKESASLVLLARGYPLHVSICAFFVVQQIPSGI